MTHAVSQEAVLLANEFGRHFQDGACALIEAEAPADILTDDTIAAMLQKERGIEVARRTVAKYREGMNIPSSVIRRRQKRALAGAG